MKEDLGIDVEAERCIAKLDVVDVEVHVQARRCRNGIRAGILAVSEAMEDLGLFGQLDLLRLTSVSFAMHLLKLDNVHFE